MKTIIALKNCFLSVAHKLANRRESKEIQKGTAFAD